MSYMCKYLLLHVFLQNSGTLSQSAGGQGQGLGTPSPHPNPAGALFELQVSRGMMFIFKPLPQMCGGSIGAVCTPILIAIKWPFHPTPTCCAPPRTPHIESLHPSQPPQLQLLISQRFLLFLGHLCPHSSLCPTFSVVLCPPRWPRSV